MAKKLLVILCFLITKSSLGQKDVDGIFIFKTYLFVDHLNYLGYGKEEFPIKSQAYFNEFIDGLILKPDTLKSTGFGSEYIFLNLNFRSDSLSLLDDKRYGSIDHKQGVKDLQYLAIPVNCDGYTIAVNKITGRSYRLQGFFGNDLLSLINELRSQSPFKALSKRAVITNISVEKIDFECIYKSIKSKSDKIYHCTEPCGEFVIRLH